MALALMSILKENNHHIVELFNEFDVDRSKSLSPDQLKALLTSVNEGVEVSDKDIEYVLKQCEPRGAADPIGMEQLKAALACWYLLAEEPLDQKVQRIKDQFAAWDTGKTGFI